MNHHYRHFNAAALLDTAKGFVPAFLATVYVGHLAGVIAGGAAMLGHWRPLFLRFARGGKVVATCGGRIAHDLSDRKASDFTTPMHDRGIQHASLFQVCDQCRRRLIDTFTNRRK